MDIRSTRLARVQGHTKPSLLFFAYLIRGEAFVIVRIDRDRYQNNPLALTEYWHRLWRLTVQLERSRRRGLGAGLAAARLRSALAAAIG